MCSRTRCVADADYFPTSTGHVEGRAVCNLVRMCSDNYGNDMSDCGAVGALIFPELLYADSYSKWLFCGPCYVLCLVFFLIAFFDRGPTFKQPQ